MKTRKLIQAKTTLRLSFAFLLLCTVSFSSNAQGGGHHGNDFNDTIQYQWNDTLSLIGNNFDNFDANDTAVNNGNDTSQTLNDTSAQGGGHHGNDFNDTIQYQWDDTLSLIGNNFDNFDANDTAVNNGNDTSQTLNDTTGYYWNDTTQMLSDPFSNNGNDTIQASNDTIGNNWNDTTNYGFQNDTSFSGNDTTGNNMDTSGCHALNGSVGNHYDLLSTGANHGRPIDGNLVYPNPMAYSAVLHISNTSNVVTFKMYEASGRIAMMKANLTNGDFDINRENLASGLYFYQILDGNKVSSTGQIIIR